MPIRNIAAGAAVAAAMALSACVRSDVADLKSDPGLTYEFQTPKPLDATYQAAVSGFTRCLTGWALRSSLVIKPRVADDHRSARIDYYQHSFRSGYWATVDFTAVAGGTKVNTYAIDNPGVRTLGPTLEKCIAGDPECYGLGDYLGSRQPIIE